MIPGLAFGQSAPTSDAGCGVARKGIPTAWPTKGVLSPEAVQQNAELPLPVNQLLLPRHNSARRISTPPPPSSHCRTLEWHAGPTHSMARRALRTEARNFFANPTRPLAGGAGLHPDVLRAIQPWLRGGYLDGNGAGDPAGNKHGTFSPILPASYPARSSSLNSNLISSNG